MVSVNFAKLSVGRPIKYMDLGTMEKYREKAIKLLEQMIRSKGEDPKDYVIRDILPKTDLGFANEEWKVSYSSAYSEETLVNVKLEEKFISIYGYANLSPQPKTTVLKFKKGVKELYVLNVQQHYIFEIPIIYFDPIGYAENDQMIISGIANATGTDNPIFFGYVAEPANKTIST